MSPTASFSTAHPVEPLLCLRQLACERDGRVLIEGLDLDFNAGEIVQIAGPNGVGKTTLLRCLASLSQYYQGEILWRGQELQSQLFGYRQNLLYLGHQTGIKAALSPRQNLAWYLGQQAREVDFQQQLDQALDAVDLFGYEDMPCHNLSAGQQRRVALARLFLSRARVWILDEPLTAIDKAGVAKLGALFEQHRDRGGLVLLTTHQELNIEHLRTVDLSHYIAANEALNND